MRFDQIDLTLEPGQVVELEVRVGLPGPEGPVGPAGPPGSINTEVLVQHVSSDNPHPAYDDLPSLSLLFENGLV